MTIPEAYRTLGLTETASAQEVKKAFRVLAHKHHPDKGGDAAKFIDIANAYEKLKDSVDFSFNVSAPVAGEMDYTKMDEYKSNEDMYWSAVHMAEFLLEQKKKAYSREVRMKVYEEAKKLGKQVRSIEIDHSTGHVEVKYHSEMLGSK